MTSSAIPDFLQGGGDMGERMRAYPWHLHPLGVSSEWPQALRTSVRLMLTTRHPVFIWWGPELYCFYNDAYAQSLGPEKHPQMLGAPGREMWTEIWPIVGPDVERVLAGEGATWHEDHLVPIRRHGKIDEVYWTYSYSPIDHEGGVGGVLVLCTETTQRVLDARRREEARQRQQRLFEQAPAFIIVMKGPEHVVEFVNDAHRRAFNSDQWLGKTIREAFPSLAGQGFFELLDGVFATGKSFHAEAAEVRYQRTPDGAVETRNLNFIYAPWTDDTGQIVGVFCEGFDVTDTHYAQQRLLLGEQRFRAAVDAVRGTLWTNDAAGRMTGEQPGWSELTGQTYDEYQGYGWSDAVHPDDAQATISAWQQAVMERRPFVFEHRVRHKSDRQWRRFAVRAIPLLDARGEIVEWVGVHTDISEQRAAAEALRDADQRKDVFIATLAHELRNPLAPIRNASQVARSPRATDAQRRWSSDVIERQVKHMGLLLDDLLDVSRITRGTLQLRRERVELAVIVGNAVETARPLIDERRHILEVQLPPEPVWLEADALRLAQVLSNLLTNSAKYSDAGGTIKLSAEADEEGLVVRVTDNGIGIEAEMIPRMFEMFSQSTHAIERSGGGLGIGLALVKGLVILHGGTVDVESKGRGEGSTFTVWLPGNAVMQPPMKKPDGRLTAAGPRRRVLVVDDNRDSAESLALILSLQGHESRCVHDGREALSIADTYQPDVVILDIGMPGLNGYETARLIRAQSWGRGVTLIAVTGWGRPDDKRRAEEAGFDHHLVKPVELDSLTGALGRGADQLPQTAGARASDRVR
jgi:PAS domain S-box-containing protein